MESKIRRSRGVDRVMTVIFYLVAIFFFALLIGFAGKVIIGGLMGAKPAMVSIIYISEPTRRTTISYAVFCL